MNKNLIFSGKSTTQKGMTFLEVLIALVILVTGILGAVAMQATAKKSSFDAMQRSLASSLAQDIIAKMRANSGNLAAYALDDYGIDLNDKPEDAVSCDTVGTLCTPAQMAAHDIYEWELALVGADVTETVNQVIKNKGGLINGRGCIYPDGNALTVVVSWQGRTDLLDSKKSKTCGISGLKRRQVVVQTFII